MKKVSLIVMLLLTVAGAFEICCLSDVHSAVRKTVTGEKSAPSEDIPFVTIDAGTTSGITTREKYVIKDEAQWVSLWQKHASTEFPPSQAPRVDFNSEMVIAVFAGEHHRPGSVIQIDHIRRADNKLYIIIGESSAGARIGKETNPYADTQPYFIARTAQNPLQIVFQGI
jgi:hypothetical protein